MATKAHAFIVHPLNGGLDLTTAPTQIAPDSFVDVENIDYFTRGARRKRLGTARYNTTVLNDPDTGLPAHFTAISPYRRMDASFLPNGRLIMTAMANSSVFGDFAGDGTFTIQWGPSLPITPASIAPFGTAASRGSIVIAGGAAVYSNDLGTQIPLKLINTTTNQLDDCAPKFSFAVVHLRRLFASGVAAEQSTVHYCAAGDITDWEGEDTGSLIFDDGDGDRVTGLSRAFRGAVYVFKGPDTGSIHAVTGRTVRQFSRGDGYVNVVRQPLEGNPHVGVS